MANPDLDPSYVSDALVELAFVVNEHWSVSLMRSEPPPRVMESVWEGGRYEKLIWLGNGTESVCWECPFGAFKRG